MTVVHKSLMMVEKHGVPITIQPTAQFYRVTTDNSFPYKFILRNNSTLRIDHRSDEIILVIAIGDGESTDSC
jgi:hypothetical protein